MLYTQKLQSLCNPEEYQKTYTYRMISNGIKFYNPELSGEYEKYLENYIEYLIQNNEKIDFESDLELKLGSQQFKKIKALGIIDDGKNVDDYSQEEIAQMGEYIRDLLYEFAEKSQKTLGKLDKSFIEKYFTKVFEQETKDLKQKPEVQGIIEQLSRINDVTGKVDDRKFINQFCTQDRREEIIEKNMEDPNINTDELEQLMILHIKNNLHITKMFNNSCNKLIKSNVDFFNSPISKEFMKKIADIHSRANNKEISKAKMWYVKNILDKNIGENDFKSLENQTVSDVLQLAYCGKLPEEQAKWIKDLVNKRLKVSTIDMEKTKEELEEYTKGKTDIQNAEELEKFFENVQKYKIANNFRISQDICDFVVKQVMDKKSVLSQDPERYQQSVERILEDYARNDLASRVKIDGQKGGTQYCYFIRDKIDSETTNGINYENGLVVVKRELVEKFLKQKDLKMFETIFHENTHTEQNYDRERAKSSNYNRYVMQKERIIRAFDKEFYRLNYSLMFIEIEAREKAARKTAELCEKIGILNNDQVTFDSGIGTGLLDYLEKISKTERQNYKTGENKKIEKKDKTNVGEYFDKLIMENPYVIKNFPELSIEYNEDGTHRKLEDFLKDIGNINEVSRRLLMTKILQKGNMLKIENAPEDLMTLISYEIPNGATRVGTVPAIHCALTKILENVNENFDKMPIEALEKMEECFNKIDEQQQNNSNSIVMKLLNRKSKKENSLGNLQEIREKVQKAKVLRLCKNSYEQTTGVERKEMAEEIKEMTKNKQKTVEEKEVEM